MPDVKTKEPLLGNKAYDGLKFVALVFLPALATFYTVASSLWGWSHAQEVVGTIVAADTFLGSMLGVSAKRYNNSDARFDGSIDKVPEDGGEKVVFNLDEHPLDLPPGKKEVTLKVNTSTTTLPQ